MIIDTRKMYSFHLTTECEYGVGCSRKAGEISRRYGARKVGLVTDSPILERGLADTVVESLKAERLDVVVYERRGEPTDKCVSNGVDFIKRESVEILIALGGGSAIDTAKAMRLMFNNPGSVTDYEGIVEKVKPPAFPIIAIPTTAGTGADLSGGAVITDSARDFKMCVVHPSMSPDISLSDPELYKALPEDQTIWSGFDALAQAIGAYVATCSQPLADALALYAVELIYNNLPSAATHVDNLEARCGMMMGSLASAMAMSKSDVVVDHVLGEVVGGYYHIPHGLTIAVYLPYAMEYNAPAVPGKFRRLAAAMGRDVIGLSDMDAAGEAVNAVWDLVGRLDIPSAKEIGVKEKDIPVLARLCSKHICVETGSNPRLVTESAAEALYRKSLAL
jgi:alcohol dehydrogenase